MYAGQAVTVSRGVDGGGASSQQSFVGRMESGRGGGSRLCVKEASERLSRERPSEERRQIDKIDDGR